MPVRFLLLTSLTLGALTGRALAVDGVLEINHAAVVAAGGYPWAPTTGNYRLTSDLRPAGSLGISLEADDIVIDFNGFALIGDGSSFDGVDGSPNPDGHTLRNGAIRRFGGKAVTSVAGCLIEDMQIKQNAGGGLEVGPNCVVRRNRIAFNGGVGGLAAQGSGVVYADNLFFGNPGGHVSGAESNGGNRCDGQTCSSPPMRRYYLTTTTFLGDEPADPGSCAAGFHFASFWEIRDTSALRYDTQLGHTESDSGAGPPTEYGWARTGGDLFDPDAGNCLAWGSDLPISDGLRVRPSRDWDRSEPSAPFEGWEVQSSACDTPARAWCVQD